MLQQLMKSEVVVGIADMKIVQGGDQTLATYALGSCVGVCIYDEVLKLGGLLHAMLSNAGEEHDNPYRYVDTGLAAMIQSLRVKGASPARMKAKLVGGAKMFGYNVTMDGDDIGSRNVRQVRTVLRQYKIPLITEETGGEMGRTIRFSLENGLVTVLRADKTQKII
ncbi:MAG: chemotaxis protein CheD [Lachnospiraceae bacterium]|nr:chemotaxis protein CheD [Lachnospiraceae bacterium]